MSKPSKDQVKNISPRLSGDQKWAEYVDWFWTKPGMKESYNMIAMGFAAGARHE